MEQIREPALRAWLNFLASPELAGRESGTLGYDTAARYVASVLESLGIQPLGENGSYFHELDLVHWERDEESAALRLRTSGRADETLPLKGAFAVGEEPAGPPCEISWNEPWTFVGDGEAAASDAYDVFHGFDWKDRVALVLPRPSSGRREDLGARLRGATKVVVISDDRVRARGGLRTPVRPEAPGAPAIALKAPASHPTVFITQKTADSVLARAGTSVEKLRQAGDKAAPFTIDGVTIELEIRARQIRSRTRNVVGVLPGSDPELKGEHVAIGAHLDHVGMHDGKVYLGADDDASGVSGVLGAAAAFSANPSRPRRSVLFLFFAAEEMGLFGSDWFTRSPPVGLESIVLQVQLDMVGRNEESKASGSKPEEKAADNLDTLHVVGSRRHSLELDPWVQRVNQQVGLRLEYDEERVYERSDQYSFGKRGVPVVFFFSGFHADYHQPTDSADKIKFAKNIRVARLAYSLAFEVANRPDRLRVNRV